MDLTQQVAEHLKKPVEKLYYKIECSEGFVYYCDPDKVQEMFDGCFMSKLDYIPGDPDERFILKIEGIGMTDAQYQEYLDETADDE